MVPAENAETQITLLTHRASAALTYLQISAIIQAIVSGTLSVSVAFVVIKG
jgi:hypothetical protein